MKKPERQSQILESAARLFSQRRFDEVLMDDIAREAGVAKGTLYTYYKEKEELYFAVVFDGISKLNELLEARASTGGSPEHRLEEVMAAILLFFRQNRFFFRLMSVEDAKAEAGRGAYRHRWQEERSKQIAVIEAVLASGMASGDFRIYHLRTQAQILRGMVRSVLTSGEDLTADQMVEVIMRTFLRGLRPDPDRPATAPA
ncbi:MAG: TetR/AcrR family transcriptional regulator [Gemmatimonadota bacterium]